MLDVVFWLICTTIAFLIYGIWEFYSYVRKVDMHLYDPDWQVRWMYHELPTVKGMSYMEIGEYTRALTRGFPGGNNDAITGYLLDEHDAQIMEDRLNNRLGLRFDCANT